MSRTLLAAVCLLSVASIAVSADWPRFRGPNGSGVSPDSTPLPVTWGEEENLRWKVDLPGPGSSSPIIVGDRVFVTYWSGYGVGRGRGTQEDLERHLLCLDRRTGKTVWDRSVKAVLPEDDYRGMFAEHGYTTHTPASDGERVFAFFGKSGVHAFDMQGKPLWNTSVGTDLDNRRWGSSSSPLLHGDLVIVPAVVENRALVALNKETGEVVWKAEAEGFASTWGSPIVVTSKEGEDEIVMAVPAEFWAFRPETGKLKWYAETIGRDSMCASPVSHDGIVYAVGGRSGSVAVRSGGSGDVSDSHVVWSGRAQARIGTPVLYGGRIHWVSSNVLNCIDAESGDQIYRGRLEGGDSNRGGNAGGGRFGGGRLGGSSEYSSPVAGDGKLFYVSRRGTMYVAKLGDKFEQLAANRFASADGDFSSTPAISDGDLFVRSSKRLYCVGLPRD